MDYGLYQQHGGILAQNTGSGSDSDEEHDSDLETSWVMLRGSGELEPLPGERILHKTRGRIAIDLSAPAPSRGLPPFSLKSDRGTAYITNKRLLFLPSRPTEQLKSFSTIILKTENSHVGANWGGFGANYWDAEVKTEPDGNIPPDFPRITMRLTFNDGGHSDWALRYEEIRGRLLNAAQIARETGNTRILNTVHDEQLPEYSPREGGSRQSQIEATQTQIEQRAESAARERDGTQPLPDEPPPGYDEAQAQAIAMQFDERAHQEAERQ
ncbi:hypothetical protein BJ170DRAFT_678534 [Xylariales sp. AK1849]|nr:hypothetical protein BJ170DRAFT_678534 [Xylariales sp. AK1849]